MPRRGFQGTKRDGNHAAYVGALRAAGLAWADTYALGSGFGDGIASLPVADGFASESLIVEIKAEKGTPTDAEIEWRKNNPLMPYLVSKHPAEAIRAFTHLSAADKALMIRVATKAYEELMR